MKTKPFFAVLTVFSVPFLALMSHADDFNAVQNGNWSDPNTWVDNTVVTNGIVPGAADSADIPSGITVTVDTNESIGFVYDSGTLIMGTNSSLNVFSDSSIATSITLIATNYGNTVIYSCNPYFAREINYYNLVLANTNWTGFSPPYTVYEFFNNWSQFGPTPMTIAGDLTLMGYVRFEQGTDGPGVSSDVTIGGNLIIGTYCAYDSSGANLLVSSNVYVYGCLDDGNAALGSTTINGNVLVFGPTNSTPNYKGGYYTNGWHVSDVTNWYAGGSLTNNGAIYGTGFGSILFNGTGAITGSNSITIPTMTVNGTYSIADTITLTTNTPTLNGTLVFDLARTNQIILRYSNTGTNVQTTQTNIYGGNLVVINSGIPPVSGNIYKFFSASNYGGAFISETFPTLAPGLGWTTNLLTSGSIAVTGVALGSPTLTFSRSGAVLTLSWDSTTYPGFSVQAQTNSSGIHSNWFPTGSGTVSPYMVNINPANPPVFYRLSNP